MGECEALIQMRKMLSDKISQMNYEVEKIDQRLASLEEISDSEHFDRYGPPFSPIIISNPLIFPYEVNSKKTLILHIEKKRRKSRLNIPARFFSFF
jgi:hypothetical protein